MKQVSTDEFGQVFITDTQRGRLEEVFKANDAVEFVGMETTDVGKQTAV